MIELTISKTDINRINNLLSELSPKAKGKAIHKGMFKASATVMKQLVNNISGIILHRRTGNLAKSMGFRIYQGNDGSLESQIGSGASLQLKRMIYANIHETGGIIRPRPENKSGLLSIPFDGGKRWVRVKQAVIPARRYMSITAEQTQMQVVTDIISKIREAGEKR